MEQKDNTGLNETELKDLINAFANGKHIEKKDPVTGEDVPSFTSGDHFSDMQISNIGFGADEYKTSKPNILKNDAVVKEILSISEAAETAIGHTIGPYADATLIQTYADRDVPVYNTRDGFTILNNMKFTQPIPNAIFRILRETSEYLNMKVGDSTSSGIPIQNSLLKSFISIFNDSTKGSWIFSPVGIKNISYICSSEILKGLKDNKEYNNVFPFHDNIVDYTEDEINYITKWLTKVATIAANNDYETGKRVAELYKNKLDGRGKVLVMKSRTEEEWVEDTNAFVIPIGLFDQITNSNSSDGFTWEADDPLIAMFDGPLFETDLEPLKKIVETACFSMNRPLLITASDFNYHITNYIRQCIQGTMYNELGEDINDQNSNRTVKPQKLKVCLMKLRNKEIQEQFLFQDLELMVGACPFSTELGKLADYSDDKEVRKQQIGKLFGTCGHISGSFAEMNFIRCEPNKKMFDERIKELEEKLECLKHIKNHNMDYNESDISFRIDRLQARTTFFYCGGRTETIKESRSLVVDDAVKAVRSAIIDKGISIGCNMAISHYIHHNFDNLVDKVLDDIHDARINITAAENYNNLKDIITSILESIEFSFGNAYRYALYNMYRDPKKTMAKWEECLNYEKPTVYNIMNNINETFDPEDPDKCTDLIVPKRTDEYLLNIILEHVGELINVGNMITILSPNLDLEQLQIKQLETGAAYAAANSVFRQ